MSIYADYPCQEFERQFFKPVDIGTYRYLVPAQKLGQMQYINANRARQDAALAILSKDSALLAKIREDQKRELTLSIEAAKNLVADAPNADARNSYAQVHVALVSQTLLPESGEPVDDDAEYYVRKNKATAELHAPWIAALYRPFVNSPSVLDIYPYIPGTVLMETERFFVESFREPEEQSPKQPVSSNDESQ